MARYTLTPAGLALGEKLPKKADTAERVFLVRERLSEYTPAERRPRRSLMSVEQMEARWLSTPPNWAGR